MPFGKGEVPVLAKLAFGMPNLAEMIQVPKGDECREEQSEMWIKVLKLELLFVFFSFIKGVTVRKFIEHTLRNCRGRG